MPELTFPLQISPVFKPKIWGRAELSPVFVPKSRAGVRLPARTKPGQRGSELVGEAWVTDDASKFLNGPPAGLSLAEALRKYGPELCGTSWKGDRFPLLAKYIFTSDWLSVQVHPDDAFANRHDPGSPGKCEMWYVVWADRKAEILLALKRPADRASLQAACQKGSAKDLLNRFQPEAGEALYVPPGTVHSMGPGLVIFEVEQNSDLTYRLDDFGRIGLDGKPRGLHLEKGLAACRPELPPERDLPRLKFREPFGSRRYVLACRHFALEELVVRKAAHFEGSRDRGEVLSALSGAGRIETQAGWFGYRSGDTWLVPPATQPYSLVPLKETRWLKFYVPDLDRDFRRPLAARRVRASQIRKVVFD